MVVEKHTHRLTKNTENEPEDHISHLAEKAKKEEKRTNKSVEWHKKLGAKT
jgi:hypothetical protein